MHVLDILMYFVLGAILYFTVRKKETDIITDMLEWFGTVFILCLYTIVYLIIFAAFDLNWIDIIKLIHNIDIISLSKGINFNL